MDDPAPGSRSDDRGRLTAALLVVLAALALTVAPGAAQAETRVKAKTAERSHTKAQEVVVCWAFEAQAGARVGISLFITKDPIGHASGETNLYHYAAGDPINVIDPTGLFGLSDISDFAAGFGDDVSFGITKRVRRALGVDNVDYCSGAYANGGYTGTGIGLATGGAGLARAAGRRGLRLADETGSFRPFARTTDEFPRLDVKGKVHGPLPRRIPDHWTRSDLDEFAADLRVSIRTRQNEALRIGEDGPHRARIDTELQLLRQAEKRLSGT